MAGSNYPPGVTGADIEEFFGDADEDTCNYCGEPLEDGLCSAQCHGSASDEGRSVEESDGE